MGLCSSPPQASSEKRVSTPCRLSCKFIIKLIHARHGASPDPVDFRFAWGGSTVSLKAVKWLISYTLISWKNNFGYHIIIYQNKHKN